ncbi:MAG: magnesium transporter, partial [Firmicutes bacterium]|nr:magnesium transporter [Bacillota bacterium]
MGYEPETAGRIMTPDYISLRREMTAAEAIEKVKRQAEDKETIYTLYVTDNGRKYEGFVRLRSLLIAKSDTKIEDIMDTGIDPVMTSTDQEEAARELQRLDILAIPVVDKENRMVGIITVDDAMDILEQETTEDMLSKAKMRDSGNSSETLIKGNLWSVWKVRLPFLAFTILGGLFSAIVLGGFEDAVLLIALPAVFFVPLVMDMGGTIGVQSSTIFIRGMTLGQINTKKMGRHIVREVGIGVSIGLVVGLLIGLVAFLWQGIILPSEIPPYLSPGIPHPLHGVAAWRIGLGLGAAIWLAMIVVCTFAAFMGFTVPFVLHKLKKDQAVATGPVITTIKDVVGLTVYLGFVWIFVIQIFGL